MKVSDLNIGDFVILERLGSRYIGVIVNLDMSNRLERGFFGVHPDGYVISFSSEELEKFEIQKIEYEVNYENE